MAAKDRRSRSANNGMMLLRGFLFWFSASLLAIVAIEWSLPLGLAITVLGGVGLGIQLVRGDSP